MTIVIHKYDVIQKKISMSTKQQSFLLLNKLKNKVLIMIIAIQ